MRPTRVLQTARTGVERCHYRHAGTWALIGLACATACAKTPPERIAADATPPSDTAASADPGSPPSEPATSASTTKDPSMDPPTSRTLAGGDAEAPANADVPADLIGAAISDAVRRTSAARDDVKVVTAEPVTWSDGSLGCPQPGMLYTQALVPGYRIVLQAAGQTLNYHVGGKGGPTFCPPERVVAPSPGSGAQRS